jgi:hypothetical protein
MAKCVPDGVLLRIAPCGGPLYEAKGEYRCEIHAKILMRLYPLGPNYKRRGAQCLTSSTRT